MFRRGWMRVSVAGALVGLVVLSLPIALAPRLRSRLTSSLAERFDSQVDLESLHVSLFPTMRATGRGGVLRHQRRSDVPPLFTIESFTADVQYVALLHTPLHLRRVRLDRLEINVPPGGMSINGPDDRDEHVTRLPSTRPKRDIPPPPPARDPVAPTAPSPLVIDDLWSERAILRILRRTPGKPPREFEIHQLSMKDTGSNRPWSFAATLTNPKPPGEIRTHGTFGPWNRTTPSLTPLKAEYEFSHADLGVFGGIRGALDSTGAFAGVLERIEVEGRATVPDFALEHAGHSVALDTTFHSIVDGTSGNTWLQPVRAKFLRTTIVVDGGVIEREHEHGRTIQLDVTIDDARLEDVLYLATRASEAPMTAALKLHARFTLPPGEAEKLERVNLEGSFELVDAHFTKTSVQAKVNELSKKAQAGAYDGRATEVASDFKGRFVMSAGVIQFSSVSFTVPGARVEVSGRYGVRSETLDFRGTVRLDAKVSGMTNGITSFFVKLIEPLFRHNQVTVIPIKVSGTVNRPKVGLDMGRMMPGKEASASRRSQRVFSPENGDADQRKGPRSRRTQSRLAGREEAECQRSGKTCAMRFARFVTHPASRPWPF
jgi:hypothetical protein